MFALPYASTHKARASNNVDLHTNDIAMSYHHASISSAQHPPSSMVAGPSSRVHGKSPLCRCGVPVSNAFGSLGASLDEVKKEKRRREIAGRLGKEMSDRRDE